MALPNGGLMTAGLGEQAAASELIAIRGARGSQDLRTSRDYVPAKPASLGRSGDKFVDSRTGKG